MMATLFVLRLRVLTDGGGVEFVCRVTRVSVEEGRSDTLGRSIGGRGSIRSSVVPAGFPFIGERLGSYVGIPTPNRIEPRAHRRNAP
jgi:hypothetical protein